MYTYMVIIFGYYGITKNTECKQIHTYENTNVRNMYWSKFLFIIYGKVPSCENKFAHAHSHVCERKGLWNVRAMCDRTLTHFWAKMMVNTMYVIAIILSLLRLFIMFDAKHNVFIWGWCYLTNKNSYMAYIIKM